MRARNAQAQATSIAWSDAQAASQNDLAARSAYDTQNMFASDAAWNGQAAYNARGAQWDNAAIASTDAW